MHCMHDVVGDCREGERDIERERERRHARAEVVGGGLTVACHGGSTFAHDPAARWAQHKGVVARYCTSGARGRCSHVGGVQGDAVDDVGTCACHDAHTLKQLRRHWPDFSRNDRGTAGGHNAGSGAPDGRRCGCPACGLQAWRLTTGSRWRAIFAAIREHWAPVFQNFRTTLVTRRGLQPRLRDGLSSGTSQGGSLRRAMSLPCFAVRTALHQEFAESLARCG